MKFYIPYILLALADLLIAGVFIFDGVSDYLLAAVVFLGLIHIGIFVMVMILIIDMICWGWVLK